MFSSQGRGLKLLCKILIVLFLTTPAFAYSSKIEVENNAFMHNNKGVTLMSEKKYNSAINEFVIGIRLLPDNPIIHPIYNNLGVANLELAKLKKEQGKTTDYRKILNKLLILTLASLGSRLHFYGDSINFLYAILCSFNGELILRI